MRGLTKKLHYDTLISINLDKYDTIEGNLMKFRDKGIKVTKRRLIKFLIEYDIPMKTDKQVNYQKLIDIYLESQLSSRKMEKVANELGIKVTYRTIQKIIKPYRS